jgi:hypothetical protein
MENHLQELIEECKQNLRLYTEKGWRHSYHHWAGKLEAYEKILRKIGGESWSATDKQGEPLQ